MSYRETYDWLMRDRSLARRIQRLLLQREELLTCLEASARYDQPYVQTSPDDKMAAIMAEVCEIDERIQQLQTERALAVIETAEAIEMLDREEERDVLTRYFVRREEVSAIAEAMSYSVSGIYKLRDRAVLRLGEKVGKK